MTRLRRGDLRLALALAAAVLLAAIIGPGVMPVRADDGSFIIVLCTDQGRVEVDAATLDPTHPADRAVKGGTCAWAAAQAGPALAAPSPDALSAVAVTARPLPRTAPAPAALAALPHPFAARAPPAPRTPPSA